MRDVKPDDLRAACGGGKRDVARAGREVENTAARANGCELDETPLPSAILSIRQRHCDEVVAVRDRGEERTDVRALSFGGGNAIVNSHQSTVRSRQSASSVGVVSHQSQENYDSMGADAPVEHGRELS